MSKSIQRRANIFYLLLFAIPLFFIVAFLIYPVLQSVYISFHFWDLKKPKRIGEFVGLMNYMEGIYSDYFFRTLMTSFQFTILTVIFGFIGAMGVALLLNENFKGRNILRTILLIPWAIPAVSNAVVWEFMFDLRYGVFSGILWHLGLISEYIPFLQHSGWALFSIVFASVWKGMPFEAMVLLASLQTVPRDLIEASKVDGAGPLTTFINVTLPWIRTSILVVLMLSTMWSLQSFALIYNLTQGGPAGATEILPYYVWIQGFRWLNMGAAVASSYVLAAISLVITIVYIKIIYRRV